MKPVLYELNEDGEAIKTLVFCSVDCRWDFESRPNGISYDVGDEDQHIPDTQCTECGLLVY